MQQVSWMSRGFPQGLRWIARCCATMFVKKVRSSLVNLLPHSTDCVLFPWLASWESLETSITSFRTRGPIHPEVHLTGSLPVLPFHGICSSEGGRRQLGELRLCWHIRKGAASEILSHNKGVIELLGKRTTTVNTPAQERRMEELWQEGSLHHWKKKRGRRKGNWAMTLTLTEASLDKGL